MMGLDGASVCARTSLLRVQARLGGAEEARGGCAMRQRRMDVEVSGKWRRWRWWASRVIDERGKEEVAAEVGMKELMNAA